MSPAPEDKAAFSGFFCACPQGYSPCPLGRNLVNLVNFSFRFRFRFSLPFGQKSINLINYSACGGKALCLLSLMRQVKNLQDLQDFAREASRRIGKNRAGE